MTNFEKDNNPGQDFKSGTFAPKNGDTSPFTFADLGSGEELRDKREVVGITSKFKHYFNDALSLTAITGYRSINGSSMADSDGTKAKALDFLINALYNQFSQEIRLNYDKNSFSGFAGANFFHEYGNITNVLTQDERSFIAMLSKAKGPMIINGEPNLAWTTSPYTRTPLQTLHTEAVNDDGSDNNSYDVFADGTYKITPKFKIIAGGRLIFEDQSSFYRVDPSPGTLGQALKKGVNNLFKPTNGLIERSKSFSDWVGRFVMQYDLSKEANVFASWSKGRRPNVIQINSDAIDYLKSETVFNYEVGLKSLFMNNRVQFNISGFIYKYTNFQTSSVDLLNGGIYKITDSGNATGKGVETELQFAATKSLSLFANYAFLDSRFDKNNSNGLAQKLAGNTFRLTPKNSGSAGISYNASLGKVGFLKLNLTGTYKSGHFFDDENTKGLYQDAYFLLNSAIQYSSLTGKYGIRFNMSNITNKKYLIDGGNTGQAFGIPTFVPGPPRFYGTQIFVNF
jgi:outer membrane receptor protein involved in Fe transport